MQQTFQCYRCSAQNYSSQPNCWNCHAQFYFDCPICHALVQYTLANCPYCKFPLPGHSNQYTQPANYQAQRTCPEPEISTSKKPWLNIVLALALSAIIGGGAVIATNNWTQPNAPLVAPYNTDYSPGDIINGYNNSQIDLSLPGIADAYKKALSAPFAAIGEVKNPGIASFSMKLMQAYDLNNNNERNVSGLASLLPDVADMHRTAMDMPLIEAGKQIKDQELSDFYQGFIYAVIHGFY